MPTARAAPHSAKQRLRAQMRDRRAGCDPARGVWLAAHLLSVIPPAVTVAGFWPLDGEIDLRPALLALAGRGNKLALPQTPPPGQALGFHRWRPGAATIPGRFGTRHPPDDPVTPDVLLVPLLAFDRRGARLGYGGGYYDRTLAALTRALAIGCGFAAQEVPQVPDEPHDRRLDAAATELGAIWFAPGDHGGGRRSICRSAARRPVLPP